MFILPPASRVARLVLIILLSSASASDVAALQDRGSSRTCTSEGEWKPASRGLGEYLDSALLATALSAQWDPDWERVIATIRPARDSTEIGDQVWVGTRDKSTEGLGSIGAWLLQARSSTPIPEGDWVEVLIGDDGKLDVRGVDFTECGPLLTTRARIESELEWAARSFRDTFEALGVDQLQVVLWMWVQEDGDVGTIQVHERSPVLQVDIVAREIMDRHARFDPARIEGITRGVWVQIPVTFNRRFGS